MSDDLVKRLHKNFINGKEWYGIGIDILTEAADRIESQSALIQEMVDLLQGAESGFISRSGPDQVWQRLRDEALSKAKSQQEGETE